MLKALFLQHKMLAAGMRDFGMIDGCLKHAEPAARVRARKKPVGEAGPSQTASSLIDSPRPNYLSRIALNHDVGRDIFQYNAASTYYGIRTDLNPRADEYLSSNPTSGVSDDGFCNQRKLSLSMVMRPCAKKSSLRDTYVRLDGDTGQIEDENFLSQPDMVTDIQSPWEPNIDPWVDSHTLPDPRGEQAEKQNAKSAGPRQ